MEASSQCRMCPVLSDPVQLQRLTGGKTKSKTKMSKGKPSDPFLIPVQSVLLVFNKHRKKISIKHCRDKAKHHSKYVNNWKPTDVRPLETYFDDLFSGNGWTRQNAIVSPITRPLWSSNKPRFKDGNPVKTVIKILRATLSYWIKVSLNMSI